MCTVFFGNGKKKIKNFFKNFNFFGFVFLMNSSENQAQKDLQNLISSKDLSSTIFRISDAVTSLDMNYLQDQISPQIVQNLLFILSNQPVGPRTLEECARCIRSYLPIQRSVSQLFYKSNNLQIIVDSLIHISSPAMRDDCITIIYEIIKTSPFLLNNTTFFSNLKTIVSYLNLPGEIIMKRTLANTLNILMSSNGKSLYFDGCMNIISQCYINNKDLTLKNQLLNIIIRNGEKNKLDSNVINAIAAKIDLRYDKDPNLFKDLFKMLILQCSNFDNSVAVIRANFKFHDLLLSHSSLCFNVELQEIILSLIQEMVAPHYFGQGVCPKTNFHIDFAKKIQPFLLTLARYNNLAPLYNMKALIASIEQFRSIIVPPEMIAILYPLATNIECCGAVCYLCHHLISNPLIIDSRIYFEAEKTFENSPTPTNSMLLLPETKNAFENYRYINKKNINNLDTLLDLFGKQKITTAEFMYQGYVKETLTIIQNNYNQASALSSPLSGSASSSLVSFDYLTLLKYLLPCLQYIYFDYSCCSTCKKTPWELQVSPFQLAKFLNKEKRCVINYSGQMATLYVKRHQTLASILGEVNNQLQIFPKSLEDSIRTKIFTSPFSQYLRYIQVEDIQVGTYFIFQTLISNNDYEIIMDDLYKYDYSKSILDILHNDDNFNLVLDSRPDTSFLNLKIVPKMKNGTGGKDDPIIISDDDSDDDVISSFVKIKTKKLQQIPNTVIDLLKIIKFLYKRIIEKHSTQGLTTGVMMTTEDRSIMESFYNYSFIKIVEKEIKSLIKSVPLTTNAIDLVLKYPFLFPLKLRILVFHLKIFQPGQRFHEVLHYFGHNPNNFEPFPPDTVFKLIVPRTNLFEIFCSSLLNFFTNPFSIDIQFENETGTGRGPTKAFFEICLSEATSPQNKLFRKTKYGYFPAPNCDPDAFKAIGALIGKALIMDCITGVTISPFFIQLTYGDFPSLDQVDPELMTMLSDPNNFIGPPGFEVPYEFPGCEGVFQDRGDITSDNVTNFIEEVKSSIISTNVVNAATKFNEGLLTVIPNWKELKLFNFQEITNLICGEPLNMIDKNSLKKATILDIGYDSNSPQIGWLFDYLETASDEKKKQFIRFVTANEFLPSGGLSALNPPFTVIKLDVEHPDSHYPQASTCSSLLKLPEYSNRATFITMFETALEYNQQDFGLE